MIEDKERYDRACHAMQTGVAFMMQHDPKQADPKHMRTGVNAAMVQIGVLAQILMDLGIIDESAFYKRMADAMEAEVARYKSEIDDITGGNVTLY